jgi:outer membrane immunogenic protein
MKKLLIASAALATLIGTPALAADMALKAAPAPMAPACIWCGWYIGANAGWIGENGGGQVTGAPIANDGSTGAALIAPLAAAAATGSLNHGQGFIGGVQAGYNWQVNTNWVLGLEADFDGTSLRNNTNIAAVTPIPGFPNSLTSSINASERLDYLGTVRARVGFVPTGPLMIYGTGGLAYGRPTANATVNEAIIPAGTCPACNAGAVNINSSSSVRAGWTAGGGMEWMFAPKWSVKVEGLYYDLGHTTSAGTLIIPNTASNFETTSVQYTDHVRGAIARAGVNLHF